MKKKLKLFLVSAIVAAACVGCGFNENKEYNIACADIFAENQIGDDATISNGRSSDIFTEALTAAIKNENITINMNFTSSYGEEKLINDISLKLDYADSNKASLKIISNENGDEVNVKGYYADNYYYSDVDGDKQKVNKSFTTFLMENDGYSFNIDTGLVSKFGCIEQGSSKIYFLQYDPIEYENGLITDFEEDGNPLDADESITVNYVNLMFEIDENNIMKGYTFTLNYDHKIGDEVNPYVYKSKVEFTDIGNTKVDEIDDVNSYPEVTESESTDDYEEITELEE